VAFYADTAAVSQLWLFWVAPLAGAAIGALVWKLLLAGPED
jgi:aquaporin Z